MNQGSDSEMRTPGWSKGLVAEAPVERRSQVEAARWPAPARGLFIAGSATVLWALVALVLAA